MKTFERIDDKTIRISETISTEKVVDIDVVKSELVTLEERKTALQNGKDAQIADFDKKIAEIDAEIALQNALLVEAEKVGVTGEPLEKIII